MENFHCRFLIVPRIKDPPGVRRKQDVISPVGPNRLLGTSPGSTTTPPPWGRVPQSTRLHSLPSVVSCPVHRGVIPTESQQT